MILGKSHDFRKIIDALLIKGGMAGGVGMTGSIFGV